MKKGSERAYDLKANPFQGLEQYISKDETCTNELFISDEDVKEMFTGEAPYAFRVFKERDELRKAMSRQFKSHKFLDVFRASLLEAYEAAHTKEEMRQIVCIYGLVWGEYCIDRFKALWMGNPGVDVLVISLHNGVAHDSFRFVQIAVNSNLQELWPEDQIQALTDFSGFSKSDIERYRILYVFDRLDSDNEKPYTMDDIDRDLNRKEASQRSLPSDVSKIDRKHHDVPGEEPLPEPMITLRVSKAERRRLMQHRHQNGKNEA